MTIMCCKLVFRASMTIMCPRIPILYIHFNYLTCGLTFVRIATNVAVL